MPKHLNLLSAATIAFGFCAPAFAADTPDAQTVVAKVNNEEITLGQMIIAYNGLPQQYQSLPADMLFTGILDQLIQQAALAQSLEGDEPNRVTIALENERRSLLAAEVVNAMRGDAVSEADVEAAYKEQYGSETPQQEYNAAHILVETREKAEELVKQLDEGADFATLARDNSSDTTSQNGGDLGWFSAGMMVKPFEDAVITLETGEVSEPIETQFGWHVIKLAETRLKEAPPLESVRDQIVAQIQQEIVGKKIEDLTAKAEVERPAEGEFDPALLSNTDLLEN